MIPSLTSSSPAGHDSRERRAPLSGTSIVVVCFGRLSSTSVWFPFTQSPQQRTIVSHCEQLVAIVPMSSSRPQTAASSSSNFQQIFNNALKVYEKRTKNDLLLHPLAAQLQACDSPSAILSVLQKQVEGLNRSRNTEDRWTK